MVFVFRCVLATTRSNKAPVGQLSGQAKVFFLINETMDFVVLSKLKMTAIPSTYYVTQLGLQLGVYIKYRHRQTWTVIFRYGSRRYGPMNEALN